MNIDLLLSKNQFAVSELLRQNHILYSDIKQGIKLGYERYGQSFAIKLINILSKDQNLSNSSDDTEMGPEAPPGSYVNDNGVTVVPGSEGSSNFWSTWGNLLGFVGKTGSTYNQFMKDISGTSTEQTQYNYQGSNLTWLYWAGGLLLLIILLILIFKK